jgi:ATP-binding cassette subfamily B protein
MTPMNLPVQRYVALLALYLKPQWRRTLLMIVCLLTGIGLQLFNPQILRYFIDTALAGGASTTLVLAGLLFIVLALANQGVSIASVYLSESVAWTATNRLRTNLVAHCLALDMSFYKSHTPGELIERIDGDVDALSNFFSEFVVNLLTSALLLLGILVLFFLVKWFVGVAMTLFSIVAFVILMYMRRRAIPLWKEQRQRSADFYGFLGEQLAGTADLRANGATGYVMRRFHLFLHDWYPIFLRANLISWDTGAITLFMFICGSALAVSLGTYLWSIKEASVGTVYLLFSYTNLLSQPLRQIQVQLLDLQRAEACIQRIETLLHIEPELRDGPGAALPQGALAVEFNNVTFGYIADEPVIHDVSFAVRAGKTLGILGRTGSGKTTLARLLFRLYDPQYGEICLNGVDIRSARLHDLRRRIGLVTQDVQLFRASVRDNLTFFNRAIPDARILATLDDVGLGAWYRSLPEGLDSELGSEGAGLSAGEAQLLAFTRVFLSDPGLVILDEASSRLDPATERRIERAIDTLFANRTAIVIAHRLTTVERADDILIIEDGRIVEYGSRAELAADPDSRFSHLLQTGLEEVSA